MHGLQIWRSVGVQSHAADLGAYTVFCLCYQALSEWHLGEIASSHAAMEEAISSAKELNDTHALAATLHFAAILGQLERNPAEVKRLVSNSIELSTRQNFSQIDWKELLVDQKKSNARCSSIISAQAVADRTSTGDSERLSLREECRW